MNDARLEPRSSQASSRRTLVLVALVLGVPVAIAVIIPLFDHARDGRGFNQTKCASNLRQIGMAMQMYANENRGVLPPSLEVTMVAEDLTSEVLICPSTNDERATGPTTQTMIATFRQPGHCSYVQAIPAGSRVEAMTPAHVLVYELPDDHAADHAGPAGMNILFGDIRVEWVPIEKGRRLVAELNAGHNPPRPVGTGGAR